MHLLPCRTDAIDLILNGASGLTARQLSRYLAHLDAGPWAAAGRRPDAIERLAEKPAGIPVSAAATVTIDAEGSVGYRFTPNVIAEAGLVLASVGGKRHGIVTPALAFGPELFEDLARANVRFRIQPITATVAPLTG